MTLHKAGYSLLIKLLAGVVALNCVTFYFIHTPATAYTILIVSVIFYLLVVNFFRFPNRQITLDDNTILAPADGKIVVIEETEETEYFKDRRIQVSIFMNIFNVHINWFPVNGIVRYFKYHKGKFSAAYLPKSSTENERTTIVVECKTDRPSSCVKLREPWPNALFPMLRKEKKPGRTSTPDLSNSVHGSTCISLSGQISR